MELIRHVAPLALGILIPSVMVGNWLGTASAELAAMDPNAKNEVIASVAEEGYCTRELKQIVRRIAGSCGLLGGQGRGCEPTDAKKVVELTPDDFNKLFLPLKDRVRIVQYDMAKSDLDESAQKTVEGVWGDRRGASFFFVVSRASPEGAVEKNRELSEKRAKAVLDHLEARFQDPDIKKQVGLLWLGEEFAQLKAEDFCTWNRSRSSEQCDEKEINRSALIAWIDCQI